MITPLIFFTVTAFLFSFGIAFFLFFKLKEKPADNVVMRQSINKAIYLNRLSELKDELSRGNLSDEECAQIRNELQKKSYEDLSCNEEIINASLSSNVLSVKKISLIFMLPFISLMLYFSLSFNKDVFEWEAKKNQLMNDVMLIFKNPEQMESNAPQLSIADFILGAQYYLQKNAHHADMWLFLGKIFLSAGGNDTQAAYAYRRAYEVAPERLDIMLGLVERLISSAGGRLNEESEKMLNKILATNPREPTALIMKGMAAFQSEKYEMSVAAFETLLSLEEKSPVLTEEAQQGRAFIVGFLSKAKEQILVQANQPANELASFIDAISVSVKGLDIAEVQDKTLFVFIKAQAQAPMPLAVIKHQIQALPLELSFSKANILNPTEPFILPNKLIVGAKVTKDGNASQAALFETALVELDAQAIKANKPIMIQLNFK